MHESLIFMMFFVIASLLTLIAGEVTRTQNVLTMQFRRIEFGSDDERYMTTQYEKIQSFYGWLLIFFGVGFVGSVIYFFVG